MGEGRGAAAHLVVVETVDKHSLKGSLQGGNGLESRTVASLIKDKSQGVATGDWQSRLFTNCLPMAIDPVGESGGLMRPRGEG